MTVNPFVPIPVILIICALMIVMKRRGVWNFIRQIIVAILIFLVNLRILIPTGEVVTVNNDIDILFVVDNTISMLAEDYNGGDRRMDAVRKDVSEIVDEFPGARYALISFNDNAQVMVPYTTEKENITVALDSLQGRSMTYAKGSSINVVYNKLRDYLEGTYFQKDEEENDDRIQLVFFISDGEMNTGDKLKSFDRLAEYINGGAVLGYGTTAGGVMHVREYSSSEETQLLTYYDSQGRATTATSKIDEKILKQIAGDLELDYKHMMDPGDVWDVTDELHAKIEAGEMSENKAAGMGYAETYWIFAAVLFAFLIYDLIYYGTKMGRGQ
ncbi:Ca-activated chloride channel family protein [Ruminococcaceae bacterium YRB3002]|nr:Ca-activated chloride channel family protein [Ruminococcaceae bacterium YRB3002]